MSQSVTYRDLALTAYGRMKEFVQFFTTFKSTPENSLKAAVFLGDFVKSVDYMERAIKVLDDQEAREFVIQVERDLNEKAGE